MFLFCAVKKCVTFSTFVQLSTYIGHTIGYFVHYIPHGIDMYTLHSSFPHDIDMPPHTNSHMYILSESLLCHSTVVFRFAFVLCCVVDSNPYQLVVAQLVERSPRLQSAVGSNPTQGSSSSFL